MIVLGERPSPTMRASEWVLAAIVASWGVVLVQPQETFSLTPIYAMLSRIASEETWGLVCLGLGIFRLAILGVQSASMAGLLLHLRTLASFVTCFFWFQVSLGVLNAGQPGVGNTAIAVYPWLFVLELICMYRVARDHAMLLAAHHTAPK